MKTCTKCCRLLPLGAFHTEMHRGKRRPKARCAQCVQGEWANYQARQKGLLPPSEMAKAFNRWPALEPGQLSPKLGLRP